VGYTNGLEWTDELLNKLRNYTLYGYNSREISGLFEDQGLVVSLSSIELAKHRHNVLKYCIERDKEITIFKEDTLPDDDYMISCDYHAPYFSELWVNRMLCIADKFGIKKHIIVGDLLDCDWAKYYYSDTKSSLDREVKHTDPLFKALDYFDMNYLLHGNHENRINRSTDGSVQARHLFHEYGKDVWDEKFRYSTYDKLNIGTDWMVVHPGSYSQIGGSVATRLAAKFQRHVLNAHGHFVALRFGRSGKHMGIDLGGMFDKSKTEYINKKTTTHPFWNNGFCALKNNHIHLFNDSTDWDYWIDDKPKPADAVGYDPYNMAMHEGRKKTDDPKSDTTIDADEKEDYRHVPDVKI